MKHSCSRAFLVAQKGNNTLMKSVLVTLEIYPHTRRGSCSSDHSWLPETIRPPARSSLADSQSDSSERNSLAHSTAACGKPTVSTGQKTRPKCPQNPFLVLQQGRWCPELATPGRAHQRARQEVCGEGLVRQSSSWCSCIDHNSAFVPKMV